MSSPVVPHEPIAFQLNGSQVEIDGTDSLGNKRSLMDVLRGDLGISSVKDGCAPQGQCGCCTVLVDGKPRVSCVTPVARVRGRKVQTLEGLPEEVAEPWNAALIECGGTQCGYCTPGIVMRLESLRSRGSLDVDSAEGALKAHMCRCTGWQGIVDASAQLGSVAESPVALKPASGTQPAASLRADRTARATLESGMPQTLAEPLGSAGFAVDSAPTGAAVAMLTYEGEWVLADSVSEARALAARVQGRRTTAASGPPIDSPPGDWDQILRTSWVEPAYLETDASWCEPGGEPQSVLVNGGAFGAKLDSPLPEISRRLAADHDQTVIALWSREDSVRFGSKRPPLAIGINGDGTGRVRVAATPGIEAAIGLAAPALEVEQIAIPGPAVSAQHRGAGWVEAFCASIAVGAPTPLGDRSGEWVQASEPDGGWARCRVVTEPSTTIELVLGAGDPVNQAVLRSFAVGAVHMAAGIVTSEALAVDEAGEVQDLTIRSFGILTARQLPKVTVDLDDQASRGRPLRVGGAVFAAAAAAIWNHQGSPESWPTRVALRDS